MTYPDSPIPKTLALPAHGGDPAAAEARFGRPTAGWLDLSTGINPFAYPVPELAPDFWRRLPDSSADLALRTAAATAWGVDDLARIVAGPGTQSLIQLLPLLRPAARVAVVGPTYAGHADAWTHAGHEIVPCAGLDDIGDAEVAIVVNPNNPDGRTHAPEALREAAAAMEERGGLLVADEAFGDLAPELSVAGEVFESLVVLRSFGKFFGLAGLRLGLAVCPPDLARLLRESLGPWPVSGPALEIGRIALADAAWIAAMRVRLAEEATKLDALLTAGGLAVLGGTSLFRLAGAPRAWSLFEHLGKRGILVRPFAEQARWLRFGLPGDEAARRRLAAALAEWTG
jgi:cobalamin biosynthetic protein CobC